MIRRLVAGLIVVGLAIGVWFVWPKNDTEPTPTTLPSAADPTTIAPTSTGAIVTTSTIPTSSSTTHVVATVEEAETILRELWFGWFEGIYNQDEERIKEVVGTAAFLEAARNAMTSLSFNAPPSAASIDFRDLKVLKADEECLAVWVVGSVPFVSATENQSVDVMRWMDDRWVLVSTWQYKEDLWQGDCAAALEPLP